MNLIAIRVGLGSHSTHARLRSDHAKPGEYEFTAYRAVRIAGEELRVSRSKGRILVS